MSSSRAITKQKEQFLSFPENLADTKGTFYAVANFTGVIRAIELYPHRDHTSTNKENAMAFLNQKQSHSINVQAVCDSDAFITKIVARWPGSTPAFLRTARSQAN